MIKYSILCACGHTVDTDVYSSTLGASSKIERYTARGVCPDCAKTMSSITIHANHKNETAPHQPEGPFVRFIGSIYQQAWAQDIRQRHFDEFVRHIQDLPLASKEELTSALIELVNKQPQAGWWIDHQYTALGALIPLSDGPIRAAIVSMILPLPRRSHARTRRAVGQA